MKNLSCFSLITGLLLMASPDASAQLFWDPNTADGVQNGSGNWNLTDALWNNGSGNTTWDNSGSAIASFGSTASKTGGTITVVDTIKVGGLRFNPFSTSTGQDLPVTLAHTITGGTLHFADDAIIEAANNSSSGSTTVLFINLNSVLKGNGLTFQRPEETRINVFQYIRFGTANPELTGVLNVNSRAADHGIFLLLSSFSTISGMSSVNVESGSVLATGGTSNNYTIPITIAGNGQGNGAIRVDSSGMRFTGGITLAADATVLTNRNVINTSIDSAITDNGSGYGFQRFASSANSVLTLNGTSTYGGTTTIGRAGSVSAGITILNFAATDAPQEDMLYHGLETAGGLTLSGGTQGTASFILQGKELTDNRQRFGDVSITGTRSNFILTPGAAGSLSVELGTISRTSPASVSFVSDVAGRFETSMDDGFLGPWATLVNSAGHGAWAGVENGKITAYTGNEFLPDGAFLGDMGSTTDVNINEYSMGDVLLGFGSPSFQINSISMTDTTSSRVVDFMGSTILRLGSTGGIQLTKDAQSLDIGVVGSAGFLRAGTGSGQLWLSNLSESGVLTINSVIENNGSSALALYINGTGKTVLTGTNTYTGVTQINSGEVEIRNDWGLGDSVASGSGTTVLSNATLRLGGGITVNEAITITGLGVKGMGALVNSDGDNTLNRVLVAAQPSRINSESGTLTFQAVNGTTDAINASGSGATTFFGGAGDITIEGRINAAANVITKDGAGTLTFAGTQSFTAAMVLSAGTVHLDFSNAASPSTDILYNGIASPVTMTLNSTLLKLTGAAGATNSQTLGTLGLTNKADITLVPNGASSLTLNFGAITRNSGSILGLDLPTGTSLRVNSGSNNTLISFNSRPYAYIRDSVNGDEWAATGVLSGSTRPVIKLSSISGYTDSTETTLSGNVNVVTGTTTLSADTTIFSLRFAQAQDALITDDAATTTLTLGGILVSSTVGEGAITLSTNNLRAAPSTVSGLHPDLTIIQNNTAAPLNITSAITNSLTSTGTTGAVSVIKSGPGLLTLSGGNSFTGSLRVYEGSVQLAGGTVSSSTEFIVGSGGNSGKVIIGSGSTNLTPAVDYILTSGVGTDNRIVGGSSGMSQILITGSVSTPSNFSTGFIGGPGENENNLELRLASLGSLVTLGANNTYRGATINSRGTIVVEKLANIGEVSSLGTGDYNSTAGIIVMANQTTGATGSYATAVLRYIGSTDSETNRPISVVNTDSITDIVTVTAELENAGTGTLKFTAPFTAGGGNVADRLLRLTGTNAGLNEIVSFTDVNSTILGKLEKDGAGTWALTGSSTYSGGSTVLKGTLLANNDPASGSATGLGDVLVQATGTLGGTGRIAPGADHSIIISGGVLNPGLPNSILMEAGALTLDTTGSGLLSLTNDAVLLFDLFAGAGSGNNTADTSAADLLKVGGQISLGAGTTLRVTNPNSMTNWTLNDQWQLFDWSGLTSPVAGNFTHYDLPSLPEGLAWNVDDLLTTGILSVSTLVVVPEPSRCLFLGLGCVGLILRRRRLRA